ncbi:MlaD family protein [Polluticoccus soli]|uniref:MlaD family protein n=1 Tax=Polluticoccus soli TaxID=3034150 RepID=UPI0023E1299B|nr:MlaD family protein [Flavipsychrobacter sp. JY13-12]
MKFSKEARIGLLVAVSLLIFFAGFYFLKGANLFSGENEYYVYYDDVQGLQPSASVQVKGLSVGRVSKIELNGGGKVKVMLAVSKKIKVVQGSSATLTTADLLGTKVIRLNMGASTTELEDEATIPGSVEGGMLDNISVEIAPLIKDVRHVVAVLDTVVIGFNDMLNPVTRQRLTNSVASLDVTMRNFSQLSDKLNRESAHLASIIRNTNSFTGNLASNNEQINQMIRNANTTMDQFSKAPINQTIKDLNHTIAQLQGVVNKVNENQGSLGMLVNDKQLYNNLTEAIKTLNFLMADINAHPSRYINVTIFGKKYKDTH